MGDAADDLGLLSRVASSDFDPRLLDPALFSPPPPPPPLRQDPLAQHRIGLVHPGNPSASSSVYYSRDISVDGPEDGEIDPSLRNLHNDGINQLPFRFDSPYLSTDNSTPNPLNTSNNTDDEDEDEEEEDEEEDDSFQLEPIPPDTTDQVEQLRQLDLEATRSLASNRSYQQELKSLMARFETASKRTSELKQFVKTLSTELLAGQEMKIFAPGTVEPQLPWFKWQFGRDLVPNPEGIERDLYLETTRFWPWSSAERTKLKQEVMSHNHRRVALEAAETGEDMGDKLASIDPEWYVENTEGLDWETISLVMTRRKAIDCKIQWLQHDHPLLNFKKFSKEEMSKLAEMVEVRGMRDWEQIAKELGNGRVGWDCLKKWRSRPGQRIEWTPEQDAKLKEAVKFHGENWQIIARLTGKHSNACINRWTKSLRPSITRGKWSLEEDETLKTAVALVGNNWKQVAPRVSGRTDAQCRERWTNVIDPKLSRTKNKPWTAQEDQELLEAVDKGRTWAQISRECFGGSKTDNKVMRRWYDLQKKPKGRSHKGKKKRLPKDTDEEDNAFDGAGAGVGGGGGRDDAEEEGGGGREEAGPPPKKRPRRQAKQKNPNLAEILARDGAGDWDDGGDGGVGGGGANGHARAGAVRDDIVVDLDVFAPDPDLGMLPQRGVELDPRVVGRDEVPPPPPPPPLAAGEEGEAEQPMQIARRGRGRGRGRGTTRDSAAVDASPPKRARGRGRARAKGK